LIYTSCDKLWRAKPSQWQARQMGRFEHKSCSLRL
jgi:hypothetical protein